MSQLRTCSLIPTTTYSIPYHTFEFKSHIIQQLYTSLLTQTVYSLEFSLCHSLCPSPYQSTDSHAATPLHTHTSVPGSRCWHIYVCSRQRAPPSKTLKCLGASKPNKSAVPGGTQKCLSTVVCMATTQDTSSLAKAFEV